MLSHRRRVCLFGTSANPPTGDGGHTGIVKALAKLDWFHEIRVLPVFRHTFESKRNQLESFHHRYNMCKISFGSIDKVVVSDAERKSFERMASTLSEEEKQGLRVGTASLLEMLLEEEENTDFTFCLGADTFLDLTSLKWKRSREVLELLEGRLVVFARKGTTLDLENQVRRVNETAGISAVLLEIPSLTDISSSSVRACKDEDQLKHYVSTGVLEYIKRNQLFSFADAPAPSSPLPT
eukprot:scaffold3079_cov119-Cylindrotheca_fusiformis.AAC.19